MNYQKVIFDILGNKPVAFNPILAKATGSITAGLFLSQLLYWFGKEKNLNGWIYKTIKEMEEETALSRKEQDGAIKRLKALKILEVSLKGVPAKRHFKINLDVLIDLISSLSKTDNPVCPKQTTQFVQKGQPNTDITSDITTDIILKEKEKNKEKETIVLYEEKNQGQIINSIIAKFENVNPSYERLFGNKTQRQAVERLLKKYNQEWLEKLIEALPKINSQPFAPIITTPYELEAKLGKLKVFLEQSKNKKGGLMSV